MMPIPISTTNVIEITKRGYPEGTRVKAIRIADPYVSIPSGTLGTVSFVDDLGTVHIKWDNNITLGVISGVDKIVAYFEEIE